MAAYYNEIDPNKAAWLRELIRQGHIAPGEVDERSIRTVRPDDLRGFTQYHFFAGIGVWSYALRLAGVRDDQEVWTGSCPCQSLSVAGKKKGFADERHLWPEWFRLIAARQPGLVFGEQSASKDALAWLDLVCDDMEGADYSIRPLDFGAASVGTPHIRQRLYFGALRLADSKRARRQSIPNVTASNGAGVESTRQGFELSEPCADAGQLANTAEFGRIGSGPSEESNKPGALERFERLRDVGGMGNPNTAGLEKRQCEPGNNVSECSTAERTGDAVGGLGNPKIGGEWTQFRESGTRGEQQEPLRGSSISQRTHATNGHWRNADWLLCTDGKWRPVESGTSPLANGAPQRVGRLRGYGDAIVATQAQVFIESYLEAYG